jgi:hypothetical protein
VSFGTTEGGSIAIVVSAPAMATDRSEKIENDEKYSDELDAENGKLAL